MLQDDKWKKLLIDWNEYQENTTSISFQFLSLNLVEKGVLHCAGLYKSPL